jgi:protein gp37
MSKSNIAWTNETWNPVTGCTKISEGCQNCYAEKMHKRLQAMGQVKYRLPFDNIYLHEKELNKDFGKKPKMIFVNSMSDLFHERACDEFINEVLLECLGNYNHIFQILTKRSERLKNFPSIEYSPHNPTTNQEYENFLDGIYPSNIWLGVTVELAKYKNRIDDLRQTNAKVKFLSCEPLLGDLGELDLSGIDWVIVGGESGSNARPMHPDWVRNIQRQCQEQGVPFFFKQWGEWIPDEYTTVMSDKDIEKYNYGRGYISVPVDICNPFYKNVQYFKKVGKKKAGCLLDGKEYKEYPNVNSR